jgi:hypothetical protein
MLQALDSDRCISEVNIITGTVVSSHRSLSHTYMRLRIGAQTNLRARWLLDDRATEPVQTRDQVTAVIPAEAVRLETGWFRRGTRRVNRWIGRIVLVHADKPDPLITVKVYGETWTLQSRGCVVGADRLPRAWETVNIVIDPAQVRLCFSSPEVMGLRSGRAVLRSWRAVECLLDEGR